MGISVSCLSSLLQPSSSFQPSRSSRDRGMEGIESRSWGGGEEEEEDDEGAAALLATLLHRLDFWGKQRRGQGQGQRI